MYNTFFLFQLNKMHNACLWSPRTWNAFILHYVWVWPSSSQARKDTHHAFSSTHYELCAFFWREWQGAERLV